MTTVGEIKTQRNSLHKKLQKLEGPERPKVLKQFHSANDKLINHHIKGAEKAVGQKNRTVLEQHAKGLHEALMKKASTFHSL